MNRLASRWLPGVCIALASAARGADAPASSPQAVFEKRIMPIFRSPNPSSCVQCHLAGVDLKHYILPSAERTFASLRDQGLIDLERPEKSKILHLIQMGEKDSAGATLMQQQSRKLEYEAFADWIKACARDERLRSLPRLKADEVAKPSRPVEVIRHARRDRLLVSFENSIWAMRFRCMNCHSEGSEQNKKLVKEHGDRVSWFKADGPAATLQYLLGSKLIDTKNPEKSLLLLKALNEVKHGGGKKFIVGDDGYKAFRSFLEDCSQTMNDRYTDATSLPKRDEGPLRFGTQAWLKITNTPAEWDDRLLRVELHAWDAGKKSWETDPVAVSDRGVSGKGKLWQHSLMLIAPKGSDRATAWQRGKPTVPPGRYLVKVYVDRDGRLARDWTALIGARDFVGEAEVRSEWPEGYGKMTVLDAGRVK